MNEHDFVSLPRDDPFVTVRVGQEEHEDVEDEEQETEREHLPCTCLHCKDLENSDQHICCRSISAWLKKYHPEGVDNFSKILSVCFWSIQ